MGKKLAIRGHATRGKEVIELLKMMGGENKFDYHGESIMYSYYVSGHVILNDRLSIIEDDDFIIFNLEEFLEKYPYKVGDKVTLDNKLCTIIWMCWECNNIYYSVQGTDVMFTKKVTSDELKPYKETNMNEDNYQETLETKVLGYNVDDIIFTDDTGWIRITKKLWDCYAEEHVYECIGILNGLEYKDIRHHDVTGKMELEPPKHCKTVDDVRYVNSITDDIMINQITNKVSVIKLKPDVCDDKIELQLGDYEIEVRDGRTFAVKKKPVYPQNYIECCSILGFKGTYDLNNIATHDVVYDWKMQNLYRLLICKNAYWKIAGEQMRLGKPWEPDWNELAAKYTIVVIENKLEKRYALTQNYILAFPTEEMRDAFYENFKELIEQCKELL